jgi:SSS family solute:Na+ symporter
VTGLVLGMTRFVAELIKDNLSGFMRYMAEINFLHFAIILFGICTAVLVLVSLASESPDQERIKNITYQSGASDGISRQNVFWYSLLLGAFILLLWLYLS